MSKLSNTIIHRTMEDGNTGGELKWNYPGNTERDSSSEISLIWWRYPQYPHHSRYSPVIVPQSSEQPDVGLVSQRISTQDPINSREIEYLHCAIKTYPYPHLPLPTPNSLLKLKWRLQLHRMKCVGVLVYCTQRFLRFGIKREQKIIPTLYNLGWDIFRKPATVMIPLTISGDPAWMKTQWMF